MIGSMRTGTRICGEIAGSSPAKPGAETPMMLEILVDRVGVHARPHVAAVVDAVLDEHDDLLGRPDRQFPQHELIHEGKDRGIRADPQRQRQDRHRGEQGSAADSAQGVAQVRQKAGHTPHTRDRGSGYAAPGLFLGGNDPIRPTAPAFSGSVFECIRPAS
jgi:hypothetical protein